jgi:hypothetical protein
MSTEHWNEGLPPLDYAARFDAAKTRALALRAEAIDALSAKLAARFRNAWHALWRGAPDAPVHVPREASTCPR